ncbi:hypothetical protein F0562_022229 [Nyssa sinensis]|uniref:Transposase MuDR plant domain-containing protein n=1 Tax=Nyssa sinensis TaxID=561372 RepID=A0A5J5BR34_9ASTE|nr:hypothetical protein F0562_022229 [Nyssa sinensis]
MSAVPCYTVDVNVTVTISSQTGEDEICDSDDFYRLTSEDEAFVPSVDENLRNSTFNTIANPSVNVEIHGGDDLSDFESNDDAEYNPSSESSNTNEGEGKGKFTSRVFEYNLYGNEYHAREGDKIALKLGQLFENMDKLREVLRDYNMRQGCNIIRDKNEKARVTAHCANSSCMWRIHTSSLPDGVTYMIKTYKGDHTCMRLQSNSNVNSSWITKKLGETIKTNPEMKVDAMQTYLQKTYGIETRKMQWPFIRIDGCHLKGPYGGVLLATVSLDGNNGLIPITVEVVESENRDNWRFFLQNLNTVIGAHSSEVPWTFMSDQQKGFDRVIAKTFSEATHRRYCQNLCANMRIKSLGMLPPTSARGSLDGSQANGS